MRIRLINLDRSSDRLAEFHSLNGHLKDVTRFAAVDGATLDPQALITDPAMGKDIVQCYSRGAVGNALSHRALWAEAVDTNAVVAVAEDDAVFHHRFEDIAEDVIGGLPAGWDLILWGWNFDGEMLFDMLPGISPALCACDQKRMREGLHQFQGQDVSPKAFRLLRAFGTPCYSVSPKGARLLMQSCFPVRPLTVHFPGINRAWPNNGIDIAMNDLYPRINAYVSVPPLILTKNETERSTVQNKPL